MSRTQLDPFASAVEMLRMLQEREASAVELLDLHLRRYERYNASLNAIAIPDYEHARQTARVADEKRSRGGAGRLLGLPVTIKDCIDVRWMRGPAGEPEYEDRRPRVDALLTARVRAAGAVIMGKTNVPPLASDWQSSNPLFGRTSNPWDPGRTPGGSTGGGAAALAAGLTPLEFGSDISGSIRVPAAFCGVYGHKPSETALPRSGHFPGDPLPNAATVMLVQGPLARSAHDLELAFDVTAGPEVGEAIAWRLEIPPARCTRLSELRVAVLPRIPWLPLDDEIAAAVDTLASQLSRAGARVKEAQPESFGDVRQHHLLFSSLLGVMTAQSQSEEDRRRQAEQDCSGEYEEAYCRAFGASAVDYLHWHTQREQHRAAYRDFFREWDILLAPNNIVNAFPHDDAPEDQRTVQVNGRPVDYYLQLVYPGIASLSGQPATAFPSGFTRAGLPIGLQAIGPYLEDRTPIQFAALVAEEFGGFRAPAGFPG